jgi:hypothetical protein
MLRRPFAFWLPAFGLLFLLWSWADSRHYNSTAALSFLNAQEITSFIISAEDSCLILQSGHVSGLRPPKKGPVLPGWHRYKLSPGRFVLLFPMPKTETKKEGIGTSGGPIHSELSSVFIPIWCLILAHIALWLSLLAWHRRRIQHHPSLPPAQPQADLELGT